HRDLVVDCGELRLRPLDIASRRGQTDRLGVAHAPPPEFDAYGALAADLDALGEGARIKALALLSSTHCRTSPDRPGCARRVPGATLGSRSSDTCRFYCETLISVYPPRSSNFLSWTNMTTCTTSYCPSSCIASFRSLRFVQSRPNKPNYPDCGPH